MKSINQFQRWKMSADFFLVMHSVQRAYNRNCMLTHRPGTFVILRGVWGWAGGGCVFSVHAAILYCLGIIFV